MGLHISSSHPASRLAAQSSHPAPSPSPASAAPPAQAKLAKENALLVQRYQELTTELGLMTQSLQRLHAANVTLQAANATLTEEGAQLRQALHEARARQQRPGLPLCLSLACRLAGSGEACPFGPVMIRAGQNDLPGSNSGGLC